MVADVDESRLTVGCLGRAPVVGIRVSWTAGAQALATASQASSVFGAELLESDLVLAGVENVAKLVGNTGVPDVRDAILALLADWRWNASQRSTVGQITRTAVVFKASKRIADTHNAQAFAAQAANVLDACATHIGLVLASVQDVAELVGSTGVKLT